MKCFQLSLSVYLDVSGQLPFNLLFWFMGFWKIWQSWSELAVVFFFFLFYFARSMKQFLVHRYHWESNFQINPVQLKNSGMCLHFCSTWQLRKSIILEKYLFFLCKYIHTWTRTHMYIHMHVGTQTHLLTYVHYKDLIINKPALF